MSFPLSSRSHGNRERHLVEPGRVQLDADARIEGEDSQPPLHRVGNPSRTGRAFQQICLPLPASRRLFDLVADDPRFGVDEHRAAGRARVVSLDDLDHPLQAEVTGESRPLAQVEGDDLERLGQVDHPELLRLLALLLQLVLERVAPGLERVPPGFAFTRDVPVALGLRQHLDELRDRRRSLAVAGRAPAQCVDGERPEPGRADPVAPEGIDERDAVAAMVVGNEIRVCGDDRAQEVPEGDLDRRQVVERAHAHVEDVAGGLGSLLRQPVHEIGMEVALRKHTGALRRDAPEIVDARLVDLLEGLEHRADEEVASGVWFDFRLVELRVRPARLPVALCVGEAERVPEAVRLPDRSAELRSNGTELAPLLEVSANRADLLPEHGALREVLEERDQVREPFVQARRRRDSCRCRTRRSGPSAAAWVTWCAITSCERQLKTTVPGNTASGPLSK